MNSNRALSLGIALVALVPIPARAQMVGRSSGGSSVTLSAPRPSTLAPIRMGSLQQRGFDRFGNNFGHLDGVRRLPQALRLNPCLNRWSSCFSPFVRTTGLLGVPYVRETVVPYAVPVYVPMPVTVQPQWAPVPQKLWQPYDPTKSRMLTIGGGVDGGGGVMRIERLENSTLRLTWHGTVRPIREARLFIADSSQKSLRSARVDIETPSALFEVANLEGKIAYTGLTVVYADGAMQTTLVPYPPREDKNP